MSFFDQIVIRVFVWITGPIPLWVLLAVALVIVNRLNAVLDSLDSLYRKLK